MFSEIPPILFFLLFVSWFSRSWQQLSIYYFVAHLEIPELIQKGKAVLWTLMVCLRLLSFSVCAFGLLNKLMTTLWSEFGIRSHTTVDVVILYSTCAPLMFDRSMLYIRLFNMTIFMYSCMNVKSIGKEQWAGFVLSWR